MTPWLGRRMSLLPLMLCGFRSGHLQPVHRVQWHNNGNWLISTGGDKVCIHDYSILSPGVQRTDSSCDLQTIRIYDLRMMRVFQTLVSDYHEPTCKTV